MGESLIDVELGVKVKEEARRLARQTAGGGKDKVGGNQEVREVDGVDLAGDGGVVSSRAGVFEHGAAIGGDPNGAKRGGSDIRGGGAKVMDGETGFINCENFGEVKGRGGGVADRDDGGGEQGSG